MKHSHDWMANMSGMEYCLCGLIRIRVQGPDDIGQHEEGQPPELTGVYSDKETYIAFQGKVVRQ